MADEPTLAEDFDELRALISQVYTTVFAAECNRAHVVLRRIRRRVLSDEEPSTRRPA